MKKVYNNHIFCVITKKQKTIWPGFLFALLFTVLAACGSVPPTAQRPGATPTTVITPAATTTTVVTPAATPTTVIPPVVPSQPTSKPTVPLTAIRMLDQTKGWALTEHSVLKTEDGGLHWSNVSPASNPIIPRSTGDFMDANTAWIAIPPSLSTPQAQRLILTLRTTDSGAHWQLSTMADPHANIVGVDRPHFVNTQDGWIEVGTGAAAGSAGVDIFHTTNGGQTWSQIASAGYTNETSGLPFGGEKTGISFKDEQNGWATGFEPMDNFFWLYRTSDGGKTWQHQSLPGDTKSGLIHPEYMTTPPVFFGNDGLLPVQVSGNRSGYEFYVTHDGGKTWALNGGGLAPLNSLPEGIYALDMQHLWAADEHGVYATSDGGQSWARVAGDNLPLIGKFSFVNPSNGWAIGTQEDKTPLLLRTTDGGKTWQSPKYMIQ